MNVKEPLHRCNLHIVISCHGSMEIMSRVKKKHIMLVGLKVFFFFTAERKFDIYQYRDNSQDYPNSTR